MTDKYNRMAKDTMQTGIATLVGGGIFGAIGGPAGTMNLLTQSLNLANVGQFAKNATDIMPRKKKGRGTNYGSF